MLRIRSIPRSHGDRLAQLHRIVAREPDALIREEFEISDAYIDRILQTAIQRGLMLGAYRNGTLVGEIHAYTPTQQAFRHLLADLTILVHPEHRGQSIGKRLFSVFLETVEQQFSHIHRVELFVREHNRKNVEFYTRLGFNNEGRQAEKIINVGGELETPLHMAWYNPAYLKSS